MKLKFACKNCGKTGPAACSKELPFLHCGWYTDYKGLVHGCLYCRACGAVHDTIGSLFGAFKLLIGRVPSKVIITMDFSTIKKLSRINNPDCPSLRSMNPYIINAMIEDGRHIEDEVLEEENPSPDFLLECLTDSSYIVRKEAIVALGSGLNVEDNRVIDRLIESLKDKHWDVRRTAASALGEIGDKKAIAPLSRLLETELWEHLVRKAVKESISILERKSAGGK